MNLAGAMAPPTAGKRLLRSQRRHLCVLCDGEASCRDMAASFLGEGLRHGQTCVLVGPQNFRNATLTQWEPAFGKRPLERLVQSGGQSSPEAMLEALGGVFQEARAAGNAIRLVGNMNWAHKKMDFDSLMDFEARLDALLKRFRVQALCQYDVRRFSSSQVLRALQCHPDTARYPLMIG